MKSRRLVKISIIAVVACFLIVLCVVLVIQGNRMTFYRSGWDELSSGVGDPADSARLIGYFFEEVDQTQHSHQWPDPPNWTWQVLIVFDQDSAAEVTEHVSVRNQSQGVATGTRTQQVTWRFRFEEGIEQNNSISFVYEAPVTKVLIGVLSPTHATDLSQGNQFQLRNGNLFCVFVNADMEFARVEQLDETLTTTATIADFQRLLPNEPDVQAIRTK